MFHLKGISLWIFMVACVVVFLGAVLFVSLLGGRSGNAWDSMFAFFDQQDPLLKNERAESDRESRRAANKGAWDIAKQRRSHEINVLRTLLDRKTEQYQLLKSKYETILAQQFIENAGAVPRAEQEIGELVDNLQTSVQQGADATLSPDAEGASSAATTTTSLADMQKQMSELKGQLETARLLAELQDEQLELLKELQTTAEENQVEMEDEFTAVLDQERTLQDVASIALISLGPTAVPVLVEALQDNRAYVREWAANVLGTLGSDANDATPALVRALADRDERVRVAARQALNRLEEKENDIKE